MGRRHTTKVAIVVGACVALALGACSGTDGGDAESAPAPAAWPHFGHDHDNSRFNPHEVLLGPDEVAGLAPLWHVEGLGGMVSTPAVVDGVVYFGDWDGVAMAVDAVTGEERWSTEVAGGPIMSSLTVSDDAVLVSTSLGLTRLDRDDGAVVWEVDTGDHPLSLVAGSPLVVEGLVVTGFASGELITEQETYTFRGSLAAYDLSSGEERWRLQTTDAATEGAGVGIWATPSVDHDRGVLYIGTGNTYEPPQAALSNSLLAVDVATGEVVWSHQFTAPDVWSVSNPDGLDADVGAGPNLFTVDGRDLVGVGDKQGDYYALDRATGEVVWETDLTPGSLLGGVMETAAHGEGRIFVASNVGDPETNLPTGTVRVFALDEADGDVVWDTELEGAVYAPITLVPGVVLVGTTAATFHALDAETGEALWSMGTPDQVGGGATVVDGVVYWGYGFLLFGGGEAGGLYALAPGADAADTGAVAASDDHAGAEVYRARCAACHGTRGQGAVGPALAGIGAAMDRDEQIEVVRDGRRGQMPAFAGTLDDDQIEAVVDYTRDRL